MSYQDTWWNYQGATIPEPFLQMVAPRGEHGGLCGNPACPHAGADWYNRGTCRHYCDACARLINEQCLEMGLRKACELRP
jgi:hypothetical protein